MVEPIFWLADFSFCIAQVERWGESKIVGQPTTYWTHVVSLNIDWSWNIFFTHICLAQILHQVIQLIDNRKLRKVKRENLIFNTQILESKLIMVGQIHIGLLFSEVDGSKIFLIKSQRLPSQCRSDIFFICHCFSCKLWLQLIVITRD